MCNLVREMVPNINSCFFDERACHFCLGYWHSEKVGISSVIAMDLAVCGKEGEERYW
jgi:hypothetical protein